MVAEGERMLRRPVLGVGLKLLCARLLKLPADSDRELLRELVEIRRRGGKQLLEERSQRLIDGVGSET